MKNQDLGEAKSNSRGIADPIIPFGLIGRILLRRDRGLIEICTYLWRRYGDVVRIRLPFQPDLYLVNDPDLVGKILIGTGKTNRKAHFFKKLRVILGNGLLSSEGETWRINRRLSNPAFHPSRLEGLSQLIVRETERMAEEWKSRLETQSEINLSEAMTDLTFRIICKALFSSDLSERAVLVREAIDSIQDLANTLFFWPVLPPWVPTRFNRKLKKALAVLDPLAYSLIAEHKADPSRYDDLLSRYLAARDEETGQGMDDRQIRDEILTLIIAGHETTASTLSMGLEAIAQHPEIAAKIVAEAADPDLPYTQLVTSEIMRLYPAIWSVAREMDEPLNHKGYHIPKDAMVLVLQMIVHRHPAHWEEPDKFQPERFQGEALKKRHPFAYFPFGGGARTCVGMSLAKLEVTQVLAVLLRSFEFKPVPGFRYTAAAKISTVPRPNIRILIRQRS